MFLFGFFGLFCSGLFWGFFLLLLCFVDYFQKLTGSISSDFTFDS